MKSAFKKISSIMLTIAIIFSLSAVSIAASPSQTTQFTSLEAMISYYNDIEMDSNTRLQVIELIQQFSKDEMFIKHYHDNPLGALNNLQYSINDLISSPQISPFGYESNLYYTNPAVRVSIQAENNWCGATSAVMVLRQQGVSTTQSRVADFIGLSHGDGAIMYQVVDAINHWKPSSYRWVDTNSSTFSSYLSNSLNDDKPVILQIYNRKFYKKVLGRTHGNYYLSTDKHYIVVDSFNTVSGDVQVKDCNLNTYKNKAHGGTHHININDLKKALSASQIIIGA